ncbi:response regulator [Cohaesibacter celericrescens]|uniref:response regulator n=1 Tax=Cohaesibacter celericrescens TaxID=2067669 RepID=UPI003561CD73
MAQGRSILIVEDDLLHREFLRKVVSDPVMGFIDVQEACDGETGLNIALTYRPDAIILDLQIPKINGVDVAKAIWAKTPQAPILFWSNYADEAYVRGIAKVAPPDTVYGYLLKSASSGRLERAMKGIFDDRQTIIDYEVVGIQKRARDKYEALTDVEYEVLLDIALGLTDSAISERLNVSMRTVQSRLQSIYSKLGLSNEPNGNRAATFNRRNRAVALALISRQINGKTLETLNKNLNGR